MQSPHKIARKVSRAIATATATRILLNIFFFCVHTYFDGEFIHVTQNYVMEMSLYGSSSTSHTVQHGIVSV